LGCVPAGRQDLQQPSSHIPLGCPGCGDEITAGDLGINPVGWAGAGQKISKVAEAEARQAGEIIEDDGEAFGKIVGFLENLKVI
jgi:hypothetical protein